MVVFFVFFFIVYFIFLYRSPTFHNFVKVALTKNPKKRPTAEKLLQHAFFQGDMHKRLAIELLQKVSNPSHMFTEMEPDEDGVNIYFWH